MRLATEYPCCKGRAVVQATASVPRETYERTCPTCGKRWDVERTTLREGEAGQPRVDKLEWTPEPGRLTN